MKINNLFCRLFFLCSYASLLMTNTIFPTSLMVGTIQFPQSISSVPMIRIYSCGKKISFDLCAIDNMAKQFMFSVPQILQHKELYILITPEVHFETKNSKTSHQNNTINYLKVLPNQPYVFYKLTLDDSQSTPDTPSSSWIIENKMLNKRTGKIPDETIIICYDPACIDSLSGGSAFELPTITLKSNLLALLGSEKELQTLSTKLLLSSIDSDTIHATIQQKIKQKNHVTLVVPVA